MIRTATRAEFRPKISAQRHEQLQDLNSTARTHEHEHRGFNWRWLEQTIRDSARLRETRSMPLVWLPRGLATNVMLIAEPRTH